MTSNRKLSFYLLTSHSV